jgi:flavin reductase (DIM6/NTAB) family NADH-FMN oxidoreductase RutF
MAASLDFDLSKLEPQQCYKLLIGLVVPRPTALLTSGSKTGVVNTAPYSFFNMFSANPALVVIGINARPDASMKDSAKNARETGVFVVNLVEEALAAAMNDCAVDFPPDMSEPGALGLPLAAGIHVPVPHLVDAPALIVFRQPSEHSPAQQPVEPTCAPVIALPEPSRAIPRPAKVPWYVAGILEDCATQDIDLGQT